MTKEALELAKRYDGDISAINKALEALDYPMLRMYSGITGDEFRCKELDNETYTLLLDAMKETLETRKQELTEKLERL